MRDPPLNIVLFFKRMDNMVLGRVILFIEQITRTKVFLMIYRKFLRPRELLEMFIERFEELGEFVDDDDEEAKNTRLRYVICHVSPTFFPFICVCSVHYSNSQAAA
jgi:hypothetical protein